MSRSSGCWQLMAATPRHLRPSFSPVQALCAEWRKSPPRIQHTGWRFREALYVAVLEEIRLKAGYGLDYNPAADHRVSWANQLLEVADGTRRAIDPNLNATAHFLLDPPPQLSGKDRAAGEHQP